MNMKLVCARKVLHQNLSETNKKLSERKFVQYFQDDYFRSSGKDKL